MLRDVVTLCEPGAALRCGALLAESDGRTSSMRDEGTRGLAVAALAAVLLPLCVGPLTASKLAIFRAVVAHTAFRRFIRGYA